MKTIDNSMLRALIEYDNGLDVYRPPPKLSLIEWADKFRRVAAKTSASPGHWRTSSQPIAFGPMAAVFDHDTDTISIMAGTQILKTELLINVAAYYICQDPSPILFVQPTQNAAQSFSKERFSPTIEATPALRNVIELPKYRDGDGVWRTAITLPEEIYTPIARAVLDELVERGLTARPAEDDRRPGIV